MRSLRRERLDRHLPAMRRIVVDELRGKWIDGGGAVEVYSADRAMTTRAEARVMLGIAETCPRGDRPQRGSRARRSGCARRDSPCWRRSIVI